MTLINHIPFRSHAAIAAKISIVFTFSHIQSYVSKTDLAVKLVKVILGPSNYDGLESLILHTKLGENRPNGSGDFLAFVSMAAMLSIRPRFHAQNFVPH